MPKFKFSNRTLVPDDDTVTVLPCKHMKEHTHTLSQASGDVTYQFDKECDEWTLLLTIERQWLTTEDIGELIDLLKAAKKYSQKLDTKRVAFNGF